MAFGRQNSGAARLEYQNKREEVWRREGVRHVSTTTGKASDLAICAKEALAVHVVSIYGLCGIHLILLECGKGGGDA